MTYDPQEQEDLLHAFVLLLRSATADGGAKRAAGEKPPWYIDTAHEPAIFSHLNKWKHGEKQDPDSGAHPLVHLAWRALAVAWQETYGPRNPVYVLSELDALDEEVDPEPQPEATDQPPPEGEWASFEAEEFTDPEGERVFSIRALLERPHFPAKPECCDSQPD